MYHECNINQTYVRTNEMYIIFMYCKSIIFLSMYNEWFTFSLCLGMLVYHRTLFKYRVDKDIIVQNQISYK